MKKMFLSYYGLEKDVFNKVISTKEAYKSKDYTNMINRLEYLKEVRGIGVFTGVTGVGKTYNIRSFIEKINVDLYKVIYISATKLSVFEFLNAICIELGLDVGSCYRNNIEKKIQEEVKKIKKEENKETIVIIDNAENLSADIIKELKILYDFNMDSQDYISIVISGLREVLDELRKAKYETLKQRIIIKYEMQGLDRKEVKEYIRSRMKISGQENEIFEENAMNALYNITNGNIRKLNMLIKTCLIIGEQNKSKTIDEEIVKMAKEETEI